MEPVRALELLFWALLLLSLVAAAGLYFSAGTPMEDFFKPWCPLLLGLAFVSAAQEGQYKGSIRGRWGPMHRQESPVMFNLHVLSYYGLGGWMIWLGLELLVWS